LAYWGRVSLHSICTLIALQLEYDGGARGV
jgi:hypothetical protein